MIASALALIALMLGVDILTDAAPAEYVAAGEPPCLWLEAKGDQLLERRLDRFSMDGTRVEVAVAELSEKGNLPLSFIAAEPEGAATFDLREPTVRQVLDAIVTSAPQYRYNVIGGRLLLYPRNQKWQARLSDLHLGPAPRLQVARDLAKELSHRMPALSDLGGGWASGNGDTYRDVVSVSGPASVVELMVQLLGNRPSTYFLVSKPKGWLGFGLSICPRDQLRSLKTTTSAAVLRRRGDTTQLKVSGTLKYGDKPIDLASSVCRTVYTSSDERVLTVDPNGVVVARENGEARIKVTNEHASDWITIWVDMPAAPEGGLR